ncbi:hypothetical protein FQR65_LT12747 [Abscondita terminalis]|nr:hypothetical protein FQR65_LT12747 [Abscondita terminalis]
MELSATLPPLIPIDYEEFPGSSSCCENAQIFPVNAVRFWPPCNENGDVIQENREQSLDWDDVSSMISGSVPALNAEVASPPAKRKGKDLRKLINTSEVTESEEEDFEGVVVVQHEKTFINNIRKSFKKVSNEFVKIQKQYRSVKNQCSKLRVQFEALEKEERILRAKRNKVLADIRKCKDYSQKLGFSLE